MCSLQGRDLMPETWHRDAAATSQGLAGESRALRACPSQLLKVLCARPPLEHCAVPACISHTRAQSSQGQTALGCPRRKPVAPAGAQQPP